jgi:hypothetical protein
VITGRSFRGIRGVTPFLKTSVVTNVGGHDQTRQKGRDRDSRQGLSLLKRDNTECVFPTSMLGIGGIYMSILVPGEGPVAFRTQGIFREANNDRRERI